MFKSAASLIDNREHRLYLYFGPIPDFYLAPQQPQLVGLIVP
jgi:hypothetical protein